MPVYRIGAEVSVCLFLSSASSLLIRLCATQIRRPCSLDSLLADVTGHVIGESAQRVYRRGGEQAVGVLGTVTTLNTAGLGEKMRGIEYSTDDESKTVSENKVN